MGKRARRKEEPRQELSSDADAFGFVERVTMALQAAGVDLSDPSAIQAWIEELNTWSGEERLGVIPDGFSGFGPPPRVSLPEDTEIPPVRLAPEPELVLAAAEVPLMARLRAFVAWVGSGRRLTETGRLRVQDARELVDVLGLGTLPADVALRSSSDLPEIDWTYALADGGLLVDVSGSRLVTTELGRSMSDRPLDAWKATFDGMLEVGAVNWFRGVKAWQPPWAQMLDDALPDLLALAYMQREEGVRAEELVGLAWEELRRQSPGPGIHTRKSQRDALAADMDRLIGALAQMGLVAREPAAFQLTPLGVWAVNGLLGEEGFEAPAVGDLAESDPATLLSWWGSLPESQLADEVDAWLETRSPEAAVRELAEPARTVAALRTIFFYVLDRLGPDAAMAIRRLRDDPALRPYAAAWLIEHDPSAQSELSEKDLMRMMVDQLAILLAAGGPDEVVEALGKLGPPAEQTRAIEILGQLGGADVKGVLTALAGSHPDPVVARAARRAESSLGAGKRKRAGRKARPI